MKTYGTITLSSGRPRTWEVSAAPYVIIKLKRVFERVDKSIPGRASINDTAENARDLLWFIERYPMDVSHRDHLIRRAAEHDAQMSFIADVMAGGYEAPNFDMAVPMRPYQEIAAGMLLRVKRLLLGDDVGLGKTASAIAAMMDPSALPAAFVTMTDLPPQVKAEINRFAPTLRVYIAKTTRPDRELGKRMTLFDAGFPDVLILSYSKLAGWKDVLAANVRYLIFDEVQELAGGSHTEKGSAAREISLRVDRCLGLSATPIRNYGGEMWNVFDILAPDALGSYEEFHREWCAQAGKSEKVKIADPEAFGGYLRDRGLLLRRTTKDVGRELPPVTIVPHFVEADTAVLKKLSGNAVDLARRIVERNYSKGIDAAAESRQFSWLLRHATGVAKAPYVAEFLRLLVQSGERVLVYGWHHDCYEIWRERLDDYRPAFFTGKETAARKRGELKRFIDGETPLLISSLRAGAGLDGLQYANCRIVVFGELDWSPTRHTQCLGRLRRDGQQSTVSAYFLVSNQAESSDPYMQDVLRLKKMQSDPILDPGRELVEQMANPGVFMRELARRFLEAHGVVVPVERDTTAA